MPPPPPHTHPARRALLSLFFFVFLSPALRSGRLCWGHARGKGPLAAGAASLRGAGEKAGGGLAYCLWGGSAGGGGALGRVEFWRTLLSLFGHSRDGGTGAGLSVSVRACRRGGGVTKKTLLGVDTPGEAGRECRARGGRGKQPPAPPCLPNVRPERTWELGKGCAGEVPGSESRRGPRWPRVRHRHARGGPDRAPSLSRASGSGFPSPKARGAGGRLFHCGKGGGGGGTSEP